MMKQCSRCKQEKPYDAFNRKTESADGYSSWCRQCKHEWYKCYYADTTARAKERERVREGKKLHPERDLKYRANNPKQVFARRTLNRAVLADMIVKPTNCQMEDATCGGEIQAHHWQGYDLANIFNVKWLCAKHHREAEKLQESNVP